MDVLLEEPPVRLEDFCRLLVQRVLRVGLLRGGGEGGGGRESRINTRGWLQYSS